MVRSSATYRRAQATWALWQLFKSPGSEAARPPAVFESRVRKLLELDRNSEDLGAELKPADFAFVDEGGPGTGGELQFTAKNVFSLGIALDLMDIGFKQSEVVFLMRYTRFEFEAQFTKITALPFRSNDVDIPASEFPQMPVEPSLEANPKRQIADLQVFAVLGKVEMTETVKTGKRSKVPIITQPKFFDGLAKLNEELKQLGYNGRKLIVLELATPARRLMHDILPGVPDLKRGRPG